MFVPHANSPAAMMSSEFFAFRERLDARLALDWSVTAWQEHAHAEVVREIAIPVLPVCFRGERRILEIRDTKLTY